MQVFDIRNLKIPEIKTFKFKRFNDNRGYFCETFRKGIVSNLKDLSFLHQYEFVQFNESFSQKNTVRGLHFQWSPYVGKLVRVVYGNMIDLALDIRPHSKTSGKIIAFPMASRLQDPYSQWIWVPPGFAHGACFVENSLIEYFCTGEYTPENEATISPFSTDINWMLCDNKPVELFKQICQHPIISEKDTRGLSFNEWINDPRSQYFE